MAVCKSLLNDHPDLGAQLVEHLDGLLAHDVVVARQAAHVVVLPLGLRPLLRGQPRPLLTLGLRRNSMQNITKMLSKKIL